VGKFHACAEASTNHFRLNVAENDKQKPTEGKTCVHVPKQKILLENTQVQQAFSYTFFQRCPNVLR
jgi:tRNA/tmRNA/rRNA uracil-C5-methylase (TrmA/RlmC/RlmD family)